MPTHVKKTTAETPHLWAIFKGHVSVAKQLVFADCDIDEENEQGQTALMFASLFDRQEIINTLIDKGANPAHMDKAGNSVADIALSQGNYELAKVYANKTLIKPRHIR